MKLIIAFALIATVVADRLENTYLPPSSAKTAGGNGNFLNAPFSKTLTAPLRSGSIPNNYLPPRNQFASAHFTSSGSNVNSGFGASIPSTNYGVPSGPVGKLGGIKTRDGGAAILRYDNDNIGDGSYKYDFDTENKISHHEIGELKNVGTEQESSYVHGSYSYTGDDGKVYTVNYVADENGFQPTGDHLPTPPPIPEAIQKSLQENAAAGGSSFGGQQSGGLNRQYLAPNTKSSSGYHY